MRSVIEIQADLEAAYASRRIALSAQSYSLDTGQGKQQVQRANLDEINKTIRLLELELETESDINGGIFSAQYARK